jgi:hypothetical protein
MPLHLNGWIGRGVPGPAIDMARGQWTRWGMNFSLVVVRAFDELTIYKGKRSYERESVGKEKIVLFQRKR